MSFFFVPGLKNVKCQEENLMNLCNVQMTSREFGELSKCQVEKIDEFVNHKIPQCHILVIFGLFGLYICQKGQKSHILFTKSC